VKILYIFLKNLKRIRMIYLLKEEFIFMVILEHGKTTFIENLLREINYDIIKYDAGDIRNKSIIDTITKHNMADKNVLSLLQKNTKKIAIIMDEIDGIE